MLEAVSTGYRSNNALAGYGYQLAVRKPVGSVLLLLVLPSVFEAWQVLQAVRSVA